MRVKERVLAALGDVEGESGARVLLAVESGSRAWGFASPDSDYDVRFIYVHPREWYLSLEERRDVIERMLPGDLDVSGWELRKALRLFARCNLALNEWIGSPIVYAREPRFHELIAALIPRYFNAIAGLHHYRRMAQAALEENLRVDGISIKKLFYVLRPLLACRWIVATNSQPPTEFSMLMSAEWVTVEERAWMNGLLRQKADANEAQSISLAAQRIAQLRAEIAAHEATASSLRAPDKPEVEDLNELLRAFVR
jgi:uncharacterized protein